MNIPDKYKYNSVNAATYIVARANDARYGINMTKLQKLLYITYGAYFAIYPEDGRLLNEHPQAWPFGPVFPTTRNKLLKKNFDEITLKNPVAEELHKDEVIRDLVTFVFKKFGTWDASQLTKWSHKPNFSRIAFGSLDMMS